MSLAHSQTDARAPLERTEPTLEPGRSTASLLIRVMGVLLVVWYLLAWAAHALPYVRPGASQIYAEKKRIIASEPIFAPEPGVRVAISGNSRVLAGFQPQLFDALSGGRVQSYNLGLPNSVEFVDSITKLVERGQAPTHLLLTVGWGNKLPPTLGERLRDDDWLMDQVFPFRSLPRDVSIFLMRSGRFGGPKRYYEHVKASLESARANRGYYFIAGQSHYPDNRLPDDFALDIDTPDVPFARNAEPRGSQYEQLMALQERSGMQIIFVPLAFREGQFAAPPEYPEVAADLAGTGIEIAGPDYWLFPPALFSDPIHMNPTGAETYTRRLWQLLSQRLDSRAVAARSVP